MRTLGWGILSALQIASVVVDAVGELCASVDRSRRCWNRIRRGVCAILGEFATSISEKFRFSLAKGAFRLFSDFDLLAWWRTRRGSREAKFIDSGGVCLGYDAAFARFLEKSQLLSRRKIVRKMYLGGSFSRD